MVGRTFFLTYSPRVCLIQAAMVFLVLLCFGCSREANQNQSPVLVKTVADEAQGVEPVIQEWRFVDQLPRKIAQFETVFWEAADTASLRKLINETDLVRGKRVLEIGTGTGLVALCCLEAGAAHVVATDVNPQAIANARYNAMLLGVSDRLEVRHVSLETPTAFSVIQPDERFDIIVSNPPWEDAQSKDISEYAFYDLGFGLLGSILNDWRRYRTEDGRLFLAYGCVSAVREVQRQCPALGQQCEILDERNLKALEELFLPGMLLEIHDEAKTEE